MTSEQFLAMVRDGILFTNPQWTKDSSKVISALAALNDNFLNKRQEGDCLYEFSNDTHVGYVLLREEQVVAMATVTH